MVGDYDVIFYLKSSNHDIIKVGDEELAGVEEGSGVDQNSSPADVVLDSKDSIIIRYSSCHAPKFQGRANGLEKWTKTNL